jgi:hypothetical protein
MHYYEFFWSAIDKKEFENTCSRRNASPPPSRIPSLTILSSRIGGMTLTMPWTAGTETSSDKSQVRKAFIAVARGLYSKTHYGHNLRIFVIS